MKNTNIYTFIVIVAVIIIALFVLNREADAPTEIPSDTTDISENTSYIWLNVEDATELANTNDEIFRVVEIDGEPRPVTMDYRPGRINASVVDGVVSDFTIEGE